VLRTAFLGAKSVWLDEAFSIAAAAIPLSDLPGWLMRVDHHPPLYYALLHGWMRLAGDSPAAVRGLSVLLSSAAIPFLYSATLQLGGRRAATAAGALLALSPWQVAFAQEARMYALLVLASAATLAATARILCAWQSVETRPRWPVWLALAVAQATAMWSHNSAVLLLPAALNAGVLGAWWLGRRWGASHTLPGLAQPGFIGRWLGWQCVAVALWLPWLPGFWAQARAVDHEFWVGTPSVAALLDLAERLAAAYLEPRSSLVWTGAGVMGWLMWRGIRAWGTQPDRLWLVLNLMLLPPVLALVASLRQPVFHSPSLIGSALPAYLLAGVGLAATKAPRRSRWGSASVWALSAALVVVLAVGLHNYYRFYPKEPWDRVTAHVTRWAASGDVVLFSTPMGELPFRYYSGDASVLDLHGIPRAATQGHRDSPVMDAADLPALRALVAGKERVWLVYTHDWYVDPLGLIPGELDSHFRARAAVRFGAIEVVRYAGAHVSTDAPARPD
jgi:uncharacterized membrane protein